MSIESNGIFWWIFLPTEYSIGGYSVWHQSVNRIFFWIFYSILFLLLTKYYVRFSIWYLRVPNANGIFYRIFCRISYRIFDRLAWTVLCCTLWTLLSTVLFRPVRTALFRADEPTGVNNAVLTVHIKHDSNHVLCCVNSTYHAWYQYCFISCWIYNFLSFTVYVIISCSIPRHKNTQYILQKIYYWRQMIIH